LLVVIFSPNPEARKYTVVEAARNVCVLYKNPVRLDRNVASRHNDVVEATWNVVAAYKNVVRLNRNVLRPDRNVV